MIDSATDRALAQKLVSVSRETWDRIDTIVDLLHKWQKTINLVAPTSLPVVWSRHVADSLQLLLYSRDARLWVDLGSGGGFPGLVIAAELAQYDGARVDLIESDSRKCAFLREAARMAGLPVNVHNQRIEQALKTWAAPVDVVSARALAPMPRLIELAYPLLKKGACGLFLKGQDVEVELTEASKSWIITATLKPSVTDSDGRIVHIEGVSRR